MLNSARYVRRCFWVSDVHRPSTATVTVAAAGPNSTTVANTKHFRDRDGRRTAGYGDDESPARDGHHREHDEVAVQGSTRDGGGAVRDERGANRQHDDEKGLQRA